MTLSPSIKAVFFDWDGTLADTSQLVVDAHNHVRALYGKPLIGMEDIFGGVTKSARESFPALYGADLAHKAEEELYGYIRDNQEKGVKPLPGAESLLRLLADNGITAGVVSNKRHAGLGLEIKTLGWAPYFAVHVGAGQAVEDKPSAAPLLLALERLGTDLTPAEVLYVGDTEADLLCARNAGAPCVYIPHAYGNPGLAAQYNPAYVFDSLDAFAAMLEEQFKKRA